MLHTIRAAGTPIPEAVIITDPLYEDPSLWSWT